MPRVGGSAGSYAEFTVSSGSKACWTIVAGLIRGGGEGGWKKFSIYTGAGHGADISPVDTACT